MDAEDQTEERVGGDGNAEVERRKPRPPPRARRIRLKSKRNVRVFVAKLTRDIAADAIEPAKARLLLNAAKVLIASIESVNEEMLDSLERQLNQLVADHEARKRREQIEAAGPSGNAPTDAVQPEAAAVGGGERAHMQAAQEQRGEIRRAYAIPRPLTARAAVHSVREERIHGEASGWQKRRRRERSRQRDSWPNTELEPLSWTIVALPHPEQALAKSASSIWSAL